MSGTKSGMRDSMRDFLMTCGMAMAMTALTLPAAAQGTSPEWANGDKVNAELTAGGGANVSEAEAAEVIAALNEKIEPLEAGFASAQEAGETPGTRVSTDAPDEPVSVDAVGEPMREDLERMALKIRALEARLNESVPEVDANSEESEPVAPEPATEAAQAEATPLEENDSPAEDEVLNVDLYASFEFEYQPGEGNGDPNGSFDADQIDLLLDYSRGDFRIAVDLAMEHGVTSEDSFGNIELSFGFAEYAHSDGLVLRAGKYLTPFGTLNEFNSLKSAFLPVKLALSTNKPDKLTGNGFRFFPRRQAGLALLGSLPIRSGSFDYNFVVSNGDQEDPNPYEEDGNLAKAITFRGVYRPNFSTGFGVSTYIDTIPGEFEDVRLFSLGVQAQYEGEHASFQTEVIYGELQPKASGSGIEQWGAFAELGYRFANLTPYLQWQYVRTRSNDPSQSAYVIIGGLNYRFREHLFVKAENAYSKGSEENEAFVDLPGLDYNEIRVALVLGF